MKILNQNKYFYRDVSNGTCSKVAKHGGFSLIEILLVIAIIGVISILTINLLQQQEQQIKVRKAALQMQQIFIAANTYYSKEGRWPQPEDTKFIDEYLPQGILNQNPWGHQYSYVPFLVDGEWRRFRITTAVVNKEIAARISNMLPNAESNDTTVIAEISLPVQYATTSSLDLVKVGNFNVSDTEGKSWNFNDNGEVELHDNEIICVVGRTTAEMVILPNSFKMYKGGIYDDASSYYITPSPEIKALGISSKQCDSVHGRENAYQCSLIYDYLASICQPWDTWIYSCINNYECTDRCDNRHYPLSGVTEYYIRDVSEGRVLSGGGVNLNYLVFCR